MLWSNWACKAAGRLRSEGSVPCSEAGKEPNHDPLSSPDAINNN